MNTIADIFRRYERDGSIRLGLGERTDKGGELARLRARDAFARALFELEPETMWDLFLPERVALCLRAHIIIRAIHDPNPVRDQGMDTADDALKRGIDEDVVPFFGSLRWWARSHNLGAPWITYAAIGWIFDFVDGYSAFLTDDDPPPYALPSGLPGISIDRRLSELVRAPGPRVMFAGKDHGAIDYWPMDVFPSDLDSYDAEPSFDWNPATESRAANERRAVKRFTARYRAAQDARLQEAESQFPSRVQSRLYEHFLWLVQYQVSRKSFSEIARDANRSRQAVTEAIRDTALFIELDLRESDGPGRKRTREKSAGIRPIEET